MANWLKKTSAELYACDDAILTKIKKACDFTEHNTISTLINSIKINKYIKQVEIKIAQFFLRFEKIREEYN